MKNINSYIVGILLAVLGLFPPLDLSIKPSIEFWPWMVAISGFLGFYTLFLRTGIVIKIIGVGGFIHCFFSSAYFVSFTAYMLIVPCLYFYILCRSIKDYSIVFKFLQCLLLITFFVFVMQIYSHDTLLNFTKQNCFGFVGQHMQSASFAVILSAVLLSKGSFNLLLPAFAAWFCNSAGALFCLIIGLCRFLYIGKYKNLMFSIISFIFLGFCSWMFFGEKAAENLDMDTGRLGAWVLILKMCLQHPFIGWGFGTFKGLFPALGGMEAIPWKTAHNCWLQILFEGGGLWLSIFFGYFISLAVRLFKNGGSYSCFIGLMMIGTNMMIHFPTRMLQTILIIIFFCAYCEGVLSHGRIKN